jgi:hypothetical protein
MRGDIVADHNDPNAVNAIFSDIDFSAADLYDLFGFPTAGGANVMLALTGWVAPPTTSHASNPLARACLTAIYAH